MSHSLPILLDLTGRHVVIVGGGAVAARKAVSLGPGTRVTVVARQVLGEFKSAVVRIKPYESADVEDADLVFAATDSAEVNDSVVRDCRARKIWCNRVDDGGDLPGDFTASARFDRGPVTVTVNAGSAALSVAIRDKLADRFDPVWADMAVAMEQLRPVIRDRSGWDSVARREKFRKLATDRAFSILSESGLAGLRQWLVEGTER